MPHDSTTYVLPSVDPNRPIPTSVSYKLQGSKLVSDYIHSSLPTITYPMQTRPKTKSFQAVLTAVDNSNALSDSEPRLIHRELHSPHSKATIDEELYASHGNQIRIMNLQKNAHGSIVKYKARLVANDFSQKVGFDFQETFNPVVKSSTIRIVLSLALYYKWSLHQININNVFLLGDLTEEVYMIQPQGFEQKTSKHLILL